jgi:hypothetical protein
VPRCAQACLPGCATCYSIVICENHRAVGLVAHCIPPRPVLPLQAVACTSWVQCCRVHRAALHLRGGQLSAPDRRNAWEWSICLQLRVAARTCGRRAWRVSGGADLSHDRLKDCIGVQEACAHACCMHLQCNLNDTRSRERVAHLATADRPDSQAAHASPCPAPLSPAIRRDPLTSSKCASRLQ